MTTPPDVILDRLDDIAARISRLEDAVRSSPTRSVPRPAVAPPPRPAPTPAPTPRPTPPPPAQITPPPQRRVTEPAPRRVNLERFVGGRLFAVVGALVVIAGAGLGMKVAWDLGYFRLLNDAGKSASMGGFGAAMLLIGELARRRWGRAAGEGLSAAGLGVLFATVYAMTARFGLLGWTPGVGALLGVAVLGFAVSARAGMVVTPAVTVAGAFVVPLLMGRPEGSPGVLALYWLTLSGLAHALCAFPGQNFAPARTCAWWGSMIVGGGWAAASIDTGDAAWPVAYLAGVWLLVHAELWRSCARRTEEWPRFLLQRAIGGGVSTTLWMLVIGLFGAHELGWKSWALPAAVAAANVGVAVSLVGVRRLARTPERPAEMLAVTLAVVGVATAMLAGMLAFGGWLEPVSFTLVGAAGILAGTRTRTEWIRACGFVNLVLGSLLALAAEPLRDVVIVSIGEIDLTRWSAVVAVAGGAWLATAFVCRVGKSAPLHTALSLALLSVSLVDGTTDVRWLGPAWGALAFAFVLAHRAEPRVRMGAVGLVGLLFAALTWAPAYLTDGWASGPVLSFGAWSVHEGLLIALGYGAMLLLGARQVRKTCGTDDFDTWIARIAVTCAAVIGFAATSYDTARLAEALTDDETARRAAVSIWWGVYALGLLAIGGWRHVPIARHTGLALLSVATLKAVLFDLASVGPGWRAASFLLLGVLLLVVATAYARSAARAAATSPTPKR